MGDPPATFADMLRKLRQQARLTQEGLAEAAGVSLGSVSDLERGVATVPHKETVRLLADALQLTGPPRAAFEAVARGRAVPGGAVATRTLPRDIATFTGRQRELGELVAAPAGASRVVSIHAIGGMAGVGKTAFAVHAAHRLAERFPAGQIFLSLHGHTPGQQPVTPGDALASLLLAAGVAAAQIPPGLDARMALWQDRLASRQLLLILDDAVGSEQVLPLLPGSGSSMVLVTSRRHLSALEDATVISLDTLPAEEAAGLLVRLADRSALQATDPGVQKIVGLCGFLPLAIGMMARQLRHHPAWSAAGRAAELAAAVDRLELIATENVSVAAAFDLSYANLARGQQRLFRRLALHPGTEFDTYTAAALDEMDLAAARRGLEGLYDRYLLTEPAQGRYRMHDLIREHARALAARDDPGHDRDAATARLLDYYQDTSARAEALLARHARPAPAVTASVTRPAVPALADPEQGLAWARIERASLLACLDHAMATDQHARVIALTTGIAGLLQHDGPWTEAMARHAAAVQTARSVGDRLGQANALNDLGEVQRLTGDFPAAARDLENALGIYRDLGERLGQANALNDLGIVQDVIGDFAAAALALEEALGIYRDLGNQLGQANALRELGAMRNRTGDVAAAALALEEALASYRNLGNRRGQANALMSLGDTRRRTRDPGAALALAEAATIYQGLGDRRGHANARLYLGITRAESGDFLAAAREMEESLALYRDLDYRLGQANALTFLGYVRRDAGNYPAALLDLEQALDMMRALGSRHGEANALVGLGTLRRVTGDYPGAARDLEEGLNICREIGDQGNEAEALNQTGILCRLRGGVREAETLHQQALDLALQIGEAEVEAKALAELGRCALTAGRTDEAAGRLRRALEIFQRIGSGDAAEVAAELDALPLLPQDCHPATQSTIPALWLKSIMRVSPAVNRMKLGFDLVRAR